MKRGEEGEQACQGAMYYMAELDTGRHCIAYRCSMHDLQFQTKPGSLDTGHVLVRTKKAPAGRILVQTKQR